MDEESAGWSKTTVEVCWAHVRRKFVEASANSNDPGWSMKMVKLIQPLYAIERVLRESKAPPEQKLKERMEKSRPIVEEFFKELAKRSFAAGWRTRVSR